MRKGGIVLDFLFPPQCLGCNLWYAFGSNAVWCSDCEVVCGEHTKIFREIEGVGVYSTHGYKINTPIARVIHALKYERIAAAADICAQYIIPIISVLHENKRREIMLVPVPLHERRLQERGFNQAELIAEACVSQIDGASVNTEILKRIRHTKSQALSHTEDERREHMENAFEAAGAYDPNTQYILIDDVVTTGSTLAACITTMRQAGARRIVVITVASTVASTTDSGLLTK